MNEYEALFEDFNETYPLPFAACAPVLENLAPDARILSHIKLPYTMQNNECYASIHSNPPGIMTDVPAAVHRNVGKGQVVFSALPLEQEPAAVYGTILLNLLKLMDFTPRLTADAPAAAELVTFDSKTSRTVAAVTLDPDHDPFAPFTVSMAWEKSPQAVRRVSTGEELPFAFQNGTLRFTTAAWDLFDLYEIIR